MKKSFFIILSTILLLLFVFNSCESSLSNGNENKVDTLESKVDSILSLMTLEEKIGQLNQYSIGAEMTGPNQTSDYSRKRYQQLINGRVGSVLNLTGAENTRLVQQQVMDSSRLKIPLIFAYDVIHGFKTIFPIPLAESCSWDLELMKKTARIAALEASASGLQWTFAPMVDVSRDPRWGRVMEGAGEDPFLGSKIAEARVIGFQGQSLADNSTIAACAKHFAGYGFVESGKDYNNVNVGNDLLMNVILPPFKKASEANVATFMNAFNDIDGIPASAHRFILRDQLKGDWGFKGVVVSDWNSIGEMVNHRYANNLKSAASQALEAGSDIDMEASAYINHLAEIVSEDPSKEIYVDEAVKRVLRLKFELGLFDDPFMYSNEERESQILGAEEHFEIAEEMAKNSIVLLKNTDNLLPILNPQTIAVIGPLADDSDSPLGNWRGNGESNSAVSLLNGLRNEFKSARISYEKGCELSIGPNNFFNELEINNNDKSGFKKAIDLAKKSEYVVMVLGEPAYMSGEGRSRSDIGLPGVQLDLLKEIYKVNRNIILVLMNGRPMTLNWENNHIPAIVEAWHLGAKSGDAIAKVVSGAFNPCGKLTMSFPKRVGQIPVYYNHKTTGRPGAAPNQVFYAHHTDVGNEPLFPFGHGLSYSEFEYSDLHLSSDTLNNDGTITASIKIQNNSTVSGTEIVQMYLTDDFSSTTRPVMELKGFDKISLLPGEKKEVSFSIDKDLLSFYNSQLEYIAESGTFKVHIGKSSVDFTSASFVLE